MTALVVLRDLIIAAAVAAVLGSALNGLSRREARQSPAIDSGAALSSQTGADTRRAARLSPKVGGAVFYAAERGR